MNTYRNVKTGAVIKTKCNITGTDWKLVKAGGEQEPGKSKQK